MIDCLEHWFSAHENEAVEVAKKIFSHPETAYEETYASQVLREYLASNGFEISEIDGLPTAFRASYGQGGPVIGILAEYDALPGMGQAPVSHYEPVDGPGHGCGHNLIAGCSAAAAAALKHYLETEDMAGTVILFGCPAEENNPTKGYMISKGVFDNVDTAFSFHGGNFNTISNFSLQAMDIADFAFSGKTAHAALNPDEGRSASDAVEIMCVGLQYLREHVKDGTRIHYQHLVMEQVPNVVSDYAKIKVVCRADSRAYCQDVLRRIVQVAEGAAMITETKVSHQRKGSWYDTVVNHTLNRVLYDAAQEIPMPEYTEEEERFAKQVYENTTGKAAGQSAMCKTMAPLSDKEVSKEDFGKTAYAKWIHKFGRISTAVALLFLYAIPFLSAEFIGTSVSIKGVLIALASLIPFIVLGATEPLSYAPIMAASGTYIGFITGRINVCVGPITSQMEKFHVEPNTKKHEIIASIVVGVMSLCAIAIMVIALIGLNFLSPMLSNPALQPGFDNIMSAMIGAFAVPMILKGTKLAMSPAAIMIVLTLILGATQVIGMQSVLLPVMLLVGLAINFGLYKMKFFNK